MGIGEALERIDLMKNPTTDEEALEICGMNLKDYTAIKKHDADHKAYVEANRHIFESQGVIHSLYIVNEASGVLSECPASNLPSNLRCNYHKACNLLSKLRKDLIQHLQDDGYHKDKDNEDCPELSYLTLRQFLIEARKRCDIGSVEGRARVAIDAKPLWEILTDGPIKSQLLHEIAELVQLSEQELKKAWFGA